MAYKSMWFEFLIIVQCSIYCCGSYGYWEYEDATFSIEEDEINFISSTIDSEDNEINFKSSTIDSDDDDEANFVGNTTQSGTISGALYIVGGIIIFVALLIGYVVCNCLKCRGSERRGHVVETSAPQESAITPAPQQPAIIEHLQPEYLQVPVQQFPIQHQQLLLQAQYASMQQSGYTYSPVPQQIQYSPVQLYTHYPQIHPSYHNPSTLEFFNPPEPPPPYELWQPHINN